MRRAFTFSALLVVSLSCGGNGSSDPFPVANSLNSLTHDGITRTYLLHVPPSYSSAHPVPLRDRPARLHEQLDVVRGAKRTERKGRSEGFDRGLPGRLALSLDRVESPGLERGRQRPQPPRRQHQIIDQMQELIRAHYAIDPARVYVTGHSNGSRMTYRVGFELSCKIAAIAPHSGQIR